jgi:hypothetical protein
MVEVPPIAVENRFLLALRYIAIELIAGWNRIGLFGIASEQDIPVVRFQFGDAYEWHQGIIFDLYNVN